jgi:hypothetical protein
LVIAVSRGAVLSAVGASQVYETSRSTALFGLSAAIHRFGVCLDREAEHGMADTIGTEDFRVETGPV